MKTQRIKMGDVAAKALEGLLNVTPDFATLQILIGENLVGLTTLDRVRGAMLGALAVLRAVERGEAERA
jgi:hypothetical protein